MKQIRKGKQVKNVFVALPVLFFLAGCVSTPAPDVTSYYDQISGLHTDLLSDNLLETGEDPRELVWLNASRIEQSRSRRSYYLEVTYMARGEVGHLEIAPGESLTLVIDDETIRLSGSGSFDTREETKDGLVQERAIYKVSKLILQKISIAKTVKVSIRGKNGLVERDFTEVNFDRFRRFVTNYAL